jgi:hypothetical protein
MEQIKAAIQQMIAADNAELDEFLGMCSVKNFKRKSVLNWSYKYDNPRIAHFIVMHALQVMPFI